MKFAIRLLTIKQVNEKSNAATDTRTHRPLSPLCEESARIAGPIPSARFLRNDRDRGRYLDVIYSRFSETADNSIESTRTSFARLLT